MGVCVVYRRRFLSLTFWVYKISCGNQSSRIELVGCDSEISDISVDLFVLRGWSGQKVKLVCFQ